MIFDGKMNSILLAFSVLFHKLWEMQFRADSKTRIILRSLSSIERFIYVSKQNGGGKREFQVPQRKISSSVWNMLFPFHFFCLRNSLSKVQILIATLQVFPLFCCLNALACATLNDVFKCVLSSSLGEHGDAIFNLSNFFSTLKKKVIPVHFLITKCF